MTMVYYPKLREQGRMEEKLYLKQYTKELSKSVNKAK